MLIRTCSLIVATLLAAASAANSGVLEKSPSINPGAPAFQVADHKDGWKEQRGRGVRKHHEEMERDDWKHRKKMEKKRRKHHKKMKRAKRNKSSLWRSAPVGAGTWLPRQERSQVQVSPP